MVLEPLLPGAAVGELDDRQVVGGHGIANATSRFAGKRIAVLAC